MNFYVGTSGYSYPEWKGSFYPAKLPAKEMLAFYAARFRTVEINNTFYRPPVASTLKAWAEQVPADFRFDGGKGDIVGWSAERADTVDRAGFTHSQHSMLPQPAR